MQQPKTQPTSAGVQRPKKVVTLGAYDQRQRQQQGATTAKPKSRGPRGTVVSEGGSSTKLAQPAAAATAIPKPRVLTKPRKVVTLAAYDQRQRQQQGATTQVPAAPTPPAPPLSPRWQVKGSSGGWVRYKPDLKKVLVIGHGFNGNIERLQQLGYDVECIYLPEYDRYPHDHATQAGHTPGQKRWLERPIDAPTHGVRDLATLADDIVLRRIRQLVSAGHGPAAVVTGSRGGQVTITRLWKGWSGPSVVLSGGCEAVDLEPSAEITLGVMCGSRDFFRTKSPAFVRQKWQRWGGTVVHYHHPHDSHAIESYNDAIGPVLGCVINNTHLPITGAGAALGNATVSVKPSAAVSFVRIR